MQYYNKPPQSGLYLLIGNAPCLYVQYIQVEEQNGELMVHGRNIDDGWYQGCGWLGPITNGDMCLKTQKVCAKRPEKGDDMGFNSTILIRNDFLNEVKDDPEFGKKVFHAIQHGPQKYPSPSGSFQVITVDHADSYYLIIAGGNAATPIAATGGYHMNPRIPKDQDTLLRRFVKQLGYRLVRLPTP